MAQVPHFSRREFFTAAVATAAAVAGYGQTPGPNVDDFFRDFTDDWVRHDPGLATGTRYFTGDTADQLARTLTPRSLQFRRDRIARARKGLADLRKFDRTRMSDIQRVSAELMDWQLENVVDEEPFLDYTYPLEQMNGANVALVENLTVRYPLTNQRDAENYLAVLSQAGAALDESTGEARRLGAKNVVPPRFILQATIKQLQSFTDPAPAKNPLVTVYLDKLTAIKAIPEAKRNELAKSAAKIVADSIYPAWKRATLQLQSQLPASTDAAGISHVQGGADAYRFFLHRFTTTSLTPDQIHQIGLDQVKRIEDQMESLFRKLNRTQGSIKDRTTKLAFDLQYPSPTSEASRAQVMKDIDVIIRDAERRAALLFDIRPKSPVVAVPFPTFREGNAASNYNAPPPDGSRPGTFQYPRRISEMYMTKFGLKSMVYHETVPGHHFQIALQVENKQLPRFRQIGAFGGISALSEGWGLYAERLAAESNWYEGNAEDLLGQLSAELFRARRLVVDTGLHAKGWSRQQGIDYGIEASEVERYAVFPGQACSYMMGQLKIIESREKAKKALGAKFSLREFHNEVLTTGTVPLELLEKQVDQWIVKQRTKA